MESKLKTITPIVQEGVHQTWSNDNGTYYKFTIEFENGDKGNCMSTKQQPSWKIGNEFEYEKVVNGEYTNIKGLKDKAQNFSKGGYKEDPLRQQYIIAQSSMKLGVDIIQMGLEKEDGTMYGMKDLEPLTDGLMGMVNKLAKKHNQ